MKKLTSRGAPNFAEDGWGAARRLARDSSTIELCDDMFPSSPVMERRVEGKRAALLEPACGARGRRAFPAACLRSPQPLNKQTTPKQPPAPANDGFDYECGLCADGS